VFSPAARQSRRSDDPALFAPQEAIFLEDKLPWVMIDKSLPSFPKTPRTA
jgi:hypothetical protein